MFFLNLNQSSVPMKQVYLHSVELKNDPKRVALAQALTLNPDKPQGGLKGKHGLYGSPEWWGNIEQGKLPLRYIAGVIRDAYVAGMDGGDENNSIELLLADGSVIEEGIYVNDKADVALFRVGCRVELVRALDEMKKQPAPDGGIYYLEVPLEMAVSLEPVK